MPTRRRFLALSGASATLALAGCLDEFQDDSGTGNGTDDSLFDSSDDGGSQPDPEVTDIDSNQNIRGAISGRTELFVLVYNHGDTGPVRAEVEIQDENRNTLERYRQTRTVRAGESYRFDFEESLPSGAYSFVGRAEPAT